MTVEAFHDNRANAWGYTVKVPGGSYRTLPRFPTYAAAMAAAAEDTEAAEIVDFVRPHLEASDA